MIRHTYQRFEEDSFREVSQRRAKLYNLPESAIEEILKKIDLADGEYEIIRDVIKYTF